MGDVDRIRQAPAYGKTERFARQPVQRAGDQAHKRHQPQQDGPALIREVEEEVDEIFLPEHAVIVEPGHIDITA